MSVDVQFVCVCALHSELVGSPSFFTNYHMHTANSWEEFYYPSKQNATDRSVWEGR